MATPPGSFYRGSSPYGAAPFSSREGLSARPSAVCDEFQLRIDPEHAELDEEVTGLHKQIKRLKNVAQAIESEATFQNEFLNQLQMTMIKAKSGVKNNMRVLNRSIAQHGSNHIFHVLLFALACFALLILWSKLFRR